MQHAKGGIAERIDALGVKILLQQTAENLVNRLVREALTDDHSSSRIGVGRQTRRSAESGELPSRIRKDLPIAPAPGFFPESPCGCSILLCPAENEGILEHSDSLSLIQCALAVCTIGQGLAAARSLKPKHAIKQVDRLLSNPAINVDDILVRWVPFVIGARDTIVVAMDWTDFDADKQATIMLALITDHGRSTPLVWLTVDKKHAQGPPRTL